MKVENDFIKREIEKLNLLLISLIEKISKSNGGNNSSDINDIDESLKSNLDLSIEKIIQLDNSELIKKVETLHDSHVEKLIDLLHLIIIKKEFNDLNKNDLAQKTILLIDYIETKSKSFSLQLMTLKNELKQIISLQ